MNKAHWPTKENGDRNTICWLCPAHGKLPEMPPTGARRIFPTTGNPDPVDIFGDMDIGIENFHVFTGNDVIFPGKSVLMLENSSFLSKKSFAIEGGPY